MSITLTIRSTKLIKNSTAKYYKFYIGNLDHISDKKIHLHIPEILHRDAEGSPLHKEQQNWTNEFLKKHNIKAKGIWFSTWEFANKNESNKFVDLLTKLGAITV